MLNDDIATRLHELKANIAETTKLMVKAKYVMGKLEKEAGIYRRFDIPRRRGRTSG